MYLTIALADAPLEVPAWRSCSKTVHFIAVQPAETAAGALLEGAAKLVMQLEVW
jgi:hypothetical protein